MGNYLKPQISQIAQICDIHQFQRLIVFFGSNSVPSPNPSYMGRGKMFPPPVPLTEGEKGGGGRLGGGAELLRFLSV